MPWTETFLRRRLGTVEGRVSSIESTLGDMGYARPNGWFGIALNTLTGQITRRGDGAFLPVSSSGMPRYIGDWVSPVLDNLRPVVLADNGSEYKEISKYDIRYHEDGSLVDFTGGHGGIFVRVPGHYYRTFVSGIYYILDFSDQPLTGFSLSPATPTGKPVYIGMFEASRVPGETKLSSIAVDPRDGVSPVWPVTQRSTDEWGMSSGASVAGLQALAAARGTGWTLEKTWWWIMHYLIHVVAYGTLNTDISVGQGRVNLTGGSWTRDIDGSNTGYIGRCGLSIPLSGHSCNSSQGGTSGMLSAVSRMLWVENRFGNVNQAMPDCLVDAQNPSAVKMYIKSAPPYSESSLTGYVTVKDNSGSDIILPGTNGYQGVPMSGLAMFASAVASGSSSTWSGDYAYVTTGAGLRGLLVGGSSNNGTYAGAVFRNSYDGPSSAGTAIGSRLGFQAA